MKYKKRFMDLINFKLGNEKKFSDTMNYKNGVDLKTLIISKSEETEMFEMIYTYDKEKQIYEHNAYAAKEKFLYFYDCEMVRVLHEL